MLNWVIDPEFVIHHCYIVNDSSLRKTMLIESMPYLTTKSAAHFNLILFVHFMIKIKSIKIIKFIHVWLQVVSGNELQTWCY